jgi:hypothetical protein
MVNAVKRTLPEANVPGMPLRRCETKYSSCEWRQPFVRFLSCPCGISPISRKGGWRLILWRAVRSGQIVVLLPVSELLAHIL